MPIGCLFLNDPYQLVHGFFRDLCSEGGRMLVDSGYPLDQVVWVGSQRVEKYEILGCEIVLGCWRYSDLGLSYKRFGIAQCVGYVTW